MENVRIEGFQVSPQQEHAWLLQMGANDLPYRVQCAVLIEGAVAADDVRSAIRGLVNRYEILRTTLQYLPNTTTLVQVISESCDAQVGFVDLSHMGYREQEIELDHIYRTLKRKPFDFERGPLFHAELVSLSSDKAVLLLSISALCADGPTFMNLVSELGESISHDSRGAGPLEGQTQYADFAHWQCEILESEETEEGKRYWQKKGGSGRVNLELPFRKSGGDRSGFEPESVSFAFSPTLAAAVESAAEASEVTVPAVLLSAWKVMLWHLTGQSDIVIGAACDGRKYAELETTPGLFTKYLPSETHLQPGFRFREVLIQVHQSLEEGYEWQECFGWDQIRGERRDEGQEPFFPFSFEFEDFPPTRPRAGVTLSIGRWYECIERFELKLCCIRNEGGLSADLHFDSSVFGENDISDLWVRFSRVLQEAVSDGNARIDGLDITSDSERRQLLFDFNDTNVSFEPTEVIHRLIEAHATSKPDSVAVVFEHQRITYDVLNARSNQLANYLQSLGVGPEVSVGICLEASPGMVIGILGVLKAGGAYVPLDPAYPKERLELMLEDSQVKIVLTERQYLEGLQLSYLEPGRGPAKTICLDAEWDVISSASASAPACGAAACNSAYVIYTSGSTGKPKGVSVSHKNLINSTQARLHYYRDPVSCFLLLSSFSFDSSIGGIFGTLCQGGTLLVASKSLRSDVPQLIISIDRHQVSHTLALPSLYSVILTHAGLHNLASLRAVIVAGAACSTGLVENHRDKLPRATLYNEYGPTEATVWSTVCECRVDNSRSRVSIGRPIANVQVFLLNPILHPVPVGMDGELYVGGANVTQGYLDRPDVTAERFVPDPFGPEPGARLYRTGDLARYRPGGDIDFLGRNDHQVKIRGYRVELGEIEAILAQHPSIRESVVVAREDISGEQRLAAYVVPYREAEGAAEELRRYMKERLPAYLVPQFFIELDALPHTPNGKVDRKALPDPDEIGSHRNREYVIPRTPVEEVVAGSWAEVLGVDQVSLNDNFFDLGGHSINTTQVIARLSSAFQVDLPVRSLFEAPTVAGLAERVEAALKSQQGLALPPIERAPRDEVLPLSFAQERLWFLHQLEPGNIAYNVAYLARLKGSLNLAALEQSLNEIVRRHENLRTTFHATDGKPLQVMAPELRSSLPVVDLGNLDEAGWESAARDLAALDARRPFVLEQGPLMRLVLVSRSEQQHMLALNMHHIISDGWSMGVFVRQLASLYQAFAGGSASPLEELPIQYADYARWQWQWSGGEVQEKQLSYWKGHLGSDLPTLDLPTDRPRPAVQTLRGAVHSFRLPADLSTLLRRFSLQQGATLFMTLLAGFQSLLSRYAGQEDIIVGTPIANRSQAELEELIGFFVNTLVMRTDVSGDPCFREILARVRETTISAYVHQHLPFEHLVDSLQPERDLARTPIFQVMFILQNAPLPKLELPGLTLDLVELHNNTAKFDLTLSMTDSDQGLVGVMEYNADLFDPTTIARMAEHLQSLLGSVVAGPELRLSTLALMSESSRHQVLVEWNESEVEFGGPPFVHRLIEAQAALTPDAVAVEFESSQLSYGELNARANRLAHLVQSLGPRPDAPIGVCSYRSLEMVVSLLGILKAGGSYLPLDPDYPAERLALVSSSASVSILLAQRQVMSKLAGSGAEIVCLDDEPESLLRQPASNPAARISGGDLSYVIYTSGSTGQPKGVMSTHEGLLNRLLWMQREYGLNQSDRVVQKTPFGFDVSVWEFFWPLMTGARLVVARRDGHKDSSYLLDLIIEREITTIHFVPSMLQAFVEEPGVENCSGLRRVICSGEALPADLPERFRARLDAPLHNLYGPTEASIDVTSWKCDFNRPPGVVPIGRPVANTRLYVLDRHLNQAPIGVPGELHIGGVQLARGYLGQPAETAEKFVPDPFAASSERMYKTGDLARYRADGSIEFLGRMDHQVKIRGFRIELGEIEAVLARHSGVRQAVVVASNDGPGGGRLVAYVVSGLDPAAIEDELSSHLRRALPEYMVPTNYVTLDAIPLTASGKVNRRALPAPTGLAREPRADFVAPRTGVEARLAEIWTEVLGLERVSVHDNFFRLGGDSILSIQIVARARQAGYHLEPKHMFQHQTIEELAAAVDSRHAVEAEQGVVTGPVPLTPVQRWFFEQDLGDPHHWNQAILLEMRHEVNPGFLEESLRHLLSHHDALRLRFMREGSGWRQINMDIEEAVAFTHLDLSGHSEATQGAAIEQIAASMQASLNLSEGPLVRLALLDLGEVRTCRLLFIIHHLAVDAVSWRILLEDLQQVYGQLSNGEAAALPPKTTSYMQWANHLAKYADSASLRSEANYWLADRWLGVCDIPVDNPDGVNTEGYSDTVFVSLDAHETKALLMDVPRAYQNHITDVLLTALAQSFYLSTGADKLLVAMEGHGRGESFPGVDISRTVGWFTAIYPVLLDLGAGADAGTALRLIKEQVRSLPQSGIGYGLMRYLGGDARVADKLRALPQPQVSFNYLGHLDRARADASWFGLAKESAGPAVSPRAHRRYLIDVTGRVMGEELQFAWKYGTQVHDRRTVERLADDFAASLRTIIAHCLADDAEGYSPSDFPEAGLSQEELDGILAEFGQSVK